MKPEIVIYSNNPPQKRISYETALTVLKEQMDAGDSVQIDSVIDLDPSNQYEVNKARSFLCRWSKQNNMKLAIQKSKKNGLTYIHLLKKGN